MEFEYFEYKKIKFPVRDCTFTNGDKSIRRRIGSEEISVILFTDHGYADDEAERLDSMIDYFIPLDELLTLSDKEILDYIYYHVDSSIFDDF